MPVNTQVALLVEVNLWINSTEDRNKSRKLTWSYRVKIKNNKRLVDLQITHKHTHTNKIWIWAKSDTKIVGEFNASWKVQIQ